MRKTRRKIKLTATQIIAIGFVVMILIGALLLTLPIASKSRESFGFFNALFTAASASCVTGLVVADTWTQFSGFGQVVLLLLIQIGGLGFMSIAMLISLALGKKMGLRERSVLMESVSSPSIGGAVPFMKRVLWGTLFIEGVGAVLLSLRFCPELGFWEGIWYGIFHSVSAFCNAGFDLMGRYGECSSLMNFQSEIYVNVVIMLLIIFGGIGFVVWEDVRINKLRFSKYMLHSKIMLTATAILIFIPAALLFFLEKDASMADMSLGQRIIASLFQSVTTRTAGFNTVDLASVSDGGILLMDVLMAIGAGAGSTAGGIKVTTFALVVLCVIEFCRGRSEVEVFGRRISPDQIRRAFCVASYFVGISIIGCIVILAVQPLPVKDVLFEVFSACGTVGLTTGITQSLTPISRIVIILLMYSGRMGSITVAMAVAEKKNNAKLQKPVERIITG
ncbi:MAG: TrkH family potassium uptake protein [Clostridiales bacterium]|nr:TrkH family potassium uptake protein [Clostridiales bacterium]